MSQSSPHSLLAQVRHVSVVSLGGDEPEPKWYVMIRNGDELARSMLTSTQSHARKIGHASHHIKHYSAAMLVKGHSDEVLAKALQLKSLYLIKSEPCQQ